MERFDSKKLSIVFDVASESDAKALIEELTDQAPETMRDMQSALMYDDKKHTVVPIDTNKPCVVQPVNKCTCKACSDDDEIYPVLRDKMSGFIDNKFDQDILNGIRYNNKYIADVVSQDIDEGNTKRAISNLLE